MIQSTALSTISFMALAGAILAGGISAQAAESDATGANTLQDTLKQQYYELSSQERKRGVTILSRHFREKAANISGEAIPNPDRVSDWPGENAAGASDARMELMKLMNSRAVLEVPEMAASAQVRFDCWIARAGIGDKNGAALCEDDFNSALHHVSTNYTQAFHQSLDATELAKRTDSSEAATPKADSEQFARAAAETPAPGTHDPFAKAPESEQDSPFSAGNADTPSAASADQSGGPYWYVRSGKTLRETLDSWADKADWTVHWKAPYEYHIEANATFEGDFEDALEKLLRAFANASPPLAGTSYKNNVVVIEALTDYAY